MGNTSREPWETEQDDYLEFCFDNWLDPDSKIAQRIWAERIGEAE